MATIRKTYSLNAYKGELPDSTLRYILEGLMAFYSAPNFKLAFKPGMFFDDLERISNKKRQTIRNAYYQAIKRGLIELDDQSLPRLTVKGRRRIKPYKPKHLQGAHLVIIFDIPEAQRWKRQHLRLLLRELSFKQVQKSVWASPYDHRDYLTAEIKQFGLSKYVVVYEARKLDV